MDQIDRPFLIFNPFALKSIEHESTLNTSAQSVQLVRLLTALSTAAKYGLAALTGRYLCYEPQIPLGGEIMIIIWRGAGGLVILIGILVCLAMNIFISKTFEEPDYFQKYLWPKLVALGVTGAWCWFLGRYLNSRPPKILIDQATGQEITWKPRHELMFIKMEYWGLIFAGIGIVLLVTQR